MAPGLLQPATTGAAVRVRMCGVVDRGRVVNRKQCKALRGTFQFVLRRIGCTRLVDFRPDTGTLRVDGPAPRERGRVVKSRSATGFRWVARSYWGL